MDSSHHLQLDMLFSDQDETLEARFRQFHADNPHVYDLLADLALQLRRKGRRHYGIGALVEVVRFHHALETTKPEFKFNNSYRSRYARLLMENIPELEGFFETRALKSL